MNRFKLIAWILGLVWILSFAYWAELRIAPGVWSLWKDCIQVFDIYLDMEEWEEALALDVILDSNMEFINFENAWLFSSYIPPRTLWKQNHFVLMDAWFNNVTWWWLLWKVYYKVIWDIDPYINFVFNWQWERTDSNVAINGIDILGAVNGWNYIIDDSISCVEFTWKVYHESDFQNIMDDVMDQVREHIQLDENENRFISNKWYLIWWFIILLVLLCMLLKRWRK